MDFKLPELGENIESIQVARVLVTVGDVVEEDQPLLEVETDKATIEVPAPEAGTVSTVHVCEGDEITVGQVVVTLGNGAEVAGDAAVTTERDAPIESEPQVAESQDAADETECEAAIPSPVTAPGVTSAAAPVPEEQPYVFTDSVKVPAAPSVRKFAREIGVDINVVKGSGPHGRVSIDDVKRHARKSAKAVSAVASVAGSIALPPLPDFTKFGDVDVQKMSAIRRKTAQHMSLSWSQIPHVTIHDAANISELDPLRKKYADRATALGGKLTMAVMVCKIVASALKKFPKFNASIDPANHTTVFKKFVNLGIAVSTERGLMVPVIRDAAGKNMVEIAAEISMIAQKARNGQIELSDLEGGTFTVTNLGRTGGRYFTPIINYPEVAILGMGRTFVSGGEGGPLTLPLSLSFDHRLIDGAEAAQFLGWIIEAIEEPLVLSLQG